MQYNCDRMAFTIHLAKESNIWLKRRAEQDTILKIIPDNPSDKIIPNYALFTAFDDQPQYMGCILFDCNGYWIYDGNELSVNEQEQVAQFILRGNR